MLQDLLQAYASQHWLHIRVTWGAFKNTNDQDTPKNNLWELVPEICILKLHQMILIVQLRWELLFIDKHVDQGVSSNTYT